MRGAGRAWRWLPLAVIWALALAVRLPFVPYAGHAYDSRNYAEWVRVIQQRGLLNFYDQENRFAVADRTYPPFATMIFAGLAAVYGREPAPLPPGDFYPPPETEFLRLLKVVPIAGELALMAIAYVLLAEKRGARILVPLSIALFPCFVIDSGWWGQYDSIFTLCVTLSLIALSRGRVVPAWLLLGTAMLLKPQGAAIGPMLLVLSYRRHGLRQTLTGMAAAGALVAFTYLPFFLASGTDVFVTYLQIGGVIPYFSNNAYNFWFLLATLHKGSPPLQHQYPDTVQIVGGLTFAHAGMFMLGVFVLLLMAVMWRRAAERREFLWAGALYFGMAMLPTEAHERYLYPAVVLLLLAAPRIPSLWVPALGSAFTLSANLILVLIENPQTGLPLGTGGASAVVAAASVALFVWVVAVVIRPARRAFAA